jgi:hypothetical protein
MMINWWCGFWVCVKYLKGNFNRIKRGLSWVCTLRMSQEKNVYIFSKNHSKFLRNKFKVKIIFCDISNGYALLIFPRTFKIIFYNVSTQQIIAAVMFLLWWLIRSLFMRFCVRQIAAFSFVFITIDMWEKRREKLMGTIKVL